MTDKNRYRERVSNGKCPKCNRRRERLDRHCCNRCLKKAAIKSRIIYRQRRANGLCGWMGCKDKDDGLHVHCAKHSKELALSVAKIYNKRYNEGRCRYCEHPATCGPLCLSHRISETKRARIRASEKKKLDSSLLKELQSA